VFAVSLAAWFVVDIRARGVDPDIADESLAYVRDHLVSLRAESHHLV
jgi:hypothetical protein